MRVRDQVAASSSLKLTRGWLLSFNDAQTPSSSYEIETAFNVLFGLWLCDCAELENRTEDSRSAANRVEQLLEGCSNTGQFDPTIYVPETLLWCDLILKRYGCTSGAIDSVARALAAVIEGCRGLPPNYLEAAMLLSELGYIEQFVLPVLTDEDLGSNAYQLVTRDREQLKKITHLVGVASGFGTSEAPLGVNTRKWLIDVMSAALFDSLRRYDLSLGASLLRTLGYLGVRSGRPVQLATEFLVGQQQRDGRFGRFSREIAEIKSSEIKKDFRENEDLYLPTALSCLWAIAEIASPGLDILGRRFKLD